MFYCLIGHIKIWDKSIIICIIMFFITSYVNNHMVALKTSMKFRATIIIYLPDIKRIENLVFVKTIEHIQADNLMSIFCFRSVCRIFDTIIKIERRTQNNDQMLYSVDPLEIVIWYILH